MHNFSGNKWSPEDEDEVVINEVDCLEGMSTGIRF